MSIETAIDDVVSATLEQQAIVGSIIIVAVSGEVAYRKAAGLLDREAGTPMREDAIFRLASFTKPLVAATVLAMIEKGLIALDAPVTAYLPYFTSRLADGSQPVITIEHLLTHTGGIVGDGPALTAAGAGSGLADTDLSLDENLRRLANVELVHAPGAGWVYGKGLDLLGGVIAAIDGSTLGDGVTRYVTGPLGLKDTGFVVRDRERLAVVYGDNRDGAPFRMTGTHTVPLRTGAGSLVFSIERSFSPKAFQSGGSGGVGTAPEFFTFLETLRRGGEPILSRDSVARGIQNRIGKIKREPGSGFGHFGAVVFDPAAAGTPQPAGTFEWGGVYGHRWFVDPVNELTAVIMTNTAIEGCNGPFPRAVRDAIYRGLGTAPPPTMNQPTTKPASYLMGPDPS
ncbi:MAG: serine hydrolase [Devosia sp.]|nr:serine hydrolase [Devosia sp.]